LNNSLKTTSIAGRRALRTAASPVRQQAARQGSTSARDLL
jgi:hypothetical protein